MRISTKCQLSVPFGAICPPLAHAERWSLLKFVLDPAGPIADRTARAQPALYVCADTKQKLLGELRSEFSRLADAGLAEVLQYCDLGSEATPLLERPGLLRLMADARRGLVSLTTARGLFKHRYAVLHCTGGGWSIDWTDRWINGSPPPPAATYIALFAGHQQSFMPRVPFTGESRVRNGRFEIGFPYGLAIDRTYAMSVDGYPIEKILASIKDVVRPWGDDSPLVCSLLGRLSRLVSLAAARSPAEVA